MKRNVAIRATNHLRFGGLHAFVAVVDAGGFSAAGRALNVEKSSLSRRIAQLEKDVGVELIRRSSRRIGLTSTGEIFYQKAVLALASARDCFDFALTASAGHTGTVRVCCPVLIAQSYLPDLIRRFSLLYPQARVELDASDRAVDFFSEGVDVIIRVREGADDIPGLIARSLLPVQRILVASSRLPIPKKFESISQLKDLPTIAFQSDLHNGEPAWRLIGSGRGARVVKISPVLVTNDLPLKVSACLNSTGVALLPSLVAMPLLQSGSLTRLFVPYHTATMYIQVVYGTLTSKNLMARNFIELLTSELPHRITKG